MRRSVRWLSVILLCGMIMSACKSDDLVMSGDLPPVVTGATVPTVVYAEESTTVTEPIVLPDIESTKRTASTEDMPVTATTTPAPPTETTESAEFSVSVLPDVPNIPIRQFTTTQATYPSVPKDEEIIDDEDSTSSAAAASTTSAASGIWASTAGSTGETSGAAAVTSQSTGENILSGTVTERAEITDPYLPYTVRPMESRPYGYKSLDAKGLYVYDAILSAIRKKSAYVDLSGMDGITTQDYCDVYELLYNDEPAMFYLDTKMQYAINTNTQSVRSATVFYKYANSEIQRMQAEIDAEADNIVSRINSNMTQYDIVKLFYDYLAENVVYDEDAPNCRDIYGVFVDKKAICGGYSKAFTYLCDKVGIETITITGDADEVPHMWNMVKLGGEWYHIDITYAVTDSKLGSYVRYDYFCVTDEVISRSRIVYDQPYTYPKATSTKCNYYVRNELVANSYDHAYMMLYNEIIRASTGKQLVAQIQCGSKTVYDDTVYELFSPARKQALDLMEDALTQSPNKFKTDNISYGQDDSTYVIKLFLEYTN